jgi:hypothetical protein
MSAAEFSRWIAYRNAYGPMDDRRVYDRPSAMLAMVVNRAIGGDAKLSDFLPYGKPEKDSDGATVANINEMAAVFGALKK